MSVVASAIHTWDWKIGDRSIFSVRTVRSGPIAGAIVLELIGELCPYSAPLLRARVDELIDNGVNRIDFDLRRLQLCTAAGLSVIDHTRARLSGLGGSLELRNAGGVVRRVLDLAGVAAA